MVVSNVVWTKNLRCRVKNLLARYKGLLGRYVPSLPCAQLYPLALLYAGRGDLPGSSEVGSSIGAACGAPCGGGCW